MKYNFYEQSRILDAIEHGLEGDLPTAHLREGAAKVIEVFDNHEPVVEGYAGFPVERDHVAKKKAQHSDDRNVGRVIRSGGESYLITGRKTDGRYQIVSKDGKKTAKAPADIGLNLQREDMVVGVDIEDLHQMMVEKKMDGVDDNGFTKCWKGYVKRGTKMKGGKEVNNCVKEATAMAKRGHDETAIRNKIAKSTGGGKSADRATALADKPTFGNDKAAKQRSDLARKQRGDFRKTTSSSPGLRGYGHKSNDPKVKAKQAARGAQRGALTPNEKKQLNREEFEIWVNDLVSEGYDLSDYTWDEMYEFYLDEALTGERYKKAVKKPGGTAYSRMVSADPKKRATRGGRGGESDFGAGDRGAGNKAARRAGTYQEEFEAFIESVIMDEEFDTLTFDELHDICVEALLEIETEEMLTEALECIDQLDLLTEVMDRGEIQRRRDQAKDRLATGAAMKKAAEKSSSSDSPAGGRREKFKAALKTAASAVRKGIVGGAKLAGKVAGHAKNLAKDASSAASDGYKSTQSSTSSSGSGTGGSDSDSDTSSSTSAKKPSAPAQKPGDSSKKGPGIASKIKKGIKKVVGVGSRAVAKASGYVAKRLGEESKYDWRKEIMGDK